MHVIHRFFRNRPRLALALAVGVGVRLALPEKWNPVSRALAGWNVTIWSYLLLMGWLMMRASHARVCKIAIQEDKCAVAVLAIMSFAAIVGLSINIAASLVGS